MLDRSSLGAHGPSIQSFGKDIDNNNNFTAIHDLLSQDEWDVFLDAMNRNEISGTLLKFGLKHPDNQFLFISPQGAEEVQCDEENRDRVSFFEVKK